MPYALIPEGFTLKKVTKAQEKAVDDLQRHEKFKSFLSSSGGGFTSGIIPLIGIGLLLLIPIIYLFLKKRGPADEDSFQAYLETKPSFWGIYAKGASGIPETLQNVILPQPVREEIESITGIDLDVGQVFNKLFAMEAELRAQQDEEAKQKIIDEYLLTK
jgi:hypothetical protein